MIVWLLVGYMWLYIHRPFEMVAMFEERNLTLWYMIFLTAVWLAGFGTKRIPRNIFTLALFLYMLVIVVSALSSPYINVFASWHLNNWLLNFVFYVILITSVKTKRDLQIIITGFIIVYFLYMTHSYCLFLLGRAGFSMGIMRLQGAVDRGASVNTFATTLVCVLPLLITLLALSKKNWHYLFILGYTLLAVRSVMLSGSRNAFIMLVALAVLPILFSRYRIYLIPIVFVALPVGWMVMPEEMQNRYRTIWDPTVERYHGMRGATSSMEGRFRGFTDGINNWLSRPITGAGPGGHMVASGSNLGAHNLPGQVAGELGTLGIIAFLFLFSCFGINHYKNWKNYKYLREKNLDKEIRYCWWVSIGSMYALAMMGMQGIGLHNAYFYPWVWFGAFLALATTLIQERVDADIRGKLLPSLPNLKS